MSIARTIYKGLLLTVFTVAAMTVPDFLTRAPGEKFQDEVSLRDTMLFCALDLKDLPGSEKGLDAGLNYYLLKKFGEDSRIPTDIRLSSPGEDFTDELTQGSLDLVAMKITDSLEHSGDLVYSIPISDSTAWLIRKDGNRRLLMQVNAWMTSTKGSRMYNRVVASFRRKGMNRYQISPYDSLVRVHAKTFGWDWRLLCSVIYHESRFSMSSTSSQGAVGLMQIVPLNHSVDSLLDPSYNIQVGARYLKRLEAMFTPLAADSLEALKFAIAAFNAGEGRIKDCIQFADESNIDSSKWDHIAEIIPEISDFHGKETIAYVDSVITTYYYYMMNYK